MLTVEKSTKADLPAIEAIYQDARRFMRENGNLTQWNGEYPNSTDAAEDMERGIGYVVRDGDEVVGVFAFLNGEEPTYRRIDGAWLQDGPYGVIHRIAVKHHGRGIAGLCFSFCEKQVHSLRIDTHRDNRAMQRALQKNGFTYCGIIYLQNGDERMAYEKIV